MVPAGFLVGIFRNRSKLHMRIAFFGKFRGKYFRKLPERFVPVKAAGSGRLFDRALINGHRKSRAVLDLSLLLLPGSIVPCIAAFSRDGNRYLPFLLNTGIRIRTHIDQSVRKAEFIFVGNAFGKSRNKELIDSAFGNQIHLMGSSVPIVKIPYDTDTGRVRCPYGKRDSVLTVHVL